MPGLLTTAVLRLALVRRNLNPFYPSIAAAAAVLLLLIPIAVPQATAQPTISLPASTIVGAGLRTAGQTASLSASSHGGVTVRIESRNSLVCLISPDATTPGAPFVDVFVPDDTGTLSYFINGVENTAGTVTVRVSAPGFVGGTGSVEVVAPGVKLALLGESRETLEPPDPFEARIGPVGTTLRQAIRPGGQPVTATFVSSDPSVGALVTASEASDTIMLTIPVGANGTPGTVITGGVAFEPLTVGATVISVAIPGFVTEPAGTRTVTVTQPQIALGFVIVGSGLQTGLITVRLSTALHGGVTLRVASSDPALCLIAPDGSTPGTPFVDLVVPNRSKSTFFVAQGVEDTTGTAAVTVTAPGFSNGTSGALVTDPGVQLAELANTIDRLDPDDPFEVWIGVPLVPGVVGTQPVRAGGAEVMVRVTCSDPTVGTLVTSAGTNDTVMVTIAVGSSMTPATLAEGGVAFRPLARGGVIVTATAPALAGMPSMSKSVTITELVPAVLRSFESRWDGTHAVVAWRLIDFVDDVDFEVYRREGPGGVFARLHDVQIARRGGDFTMVDEASERGVTYTYRVVVIEGGSAITSFETTITTPALRLALMQNHPNPFNPSTRIGFELPRAMRVNLSVYDIQGKLVVTLAEGTMAKGAREVVWDGKGARGAPVSSGVYFYRLRAGTRTFTKKLVFLK
ncbi:MAG: FlgD immunoglobulin-like domain containing protein [Candidatus Krumholzibacteria bacterium]